MDWNLHQLVQRPLVLRHTLRGCVDWNRNREIGSIRLEKSHPSWVCGLKHCDNGHCKSYGKSHPSWVCGLKHIICRTQIVYVSHTLRGCVDWNQATKSKRNLRHSSHPSWVCGLKLLRYLQRNRRISHTLRGCVDWNSSGLIPKWASTCHTLRGCVDWNINTKFILIENNVTPFVGVWIETIFRLLAYQKICVTPFVGVWIETQSSYYNQMSGLSHPSWVCGLKHYQALQEEVIICHTLRGCVDWNSLLIIY